MEKTINIKIAELKEMLLNVVNNSGLPLSVVRMIFLEYINALTEASEKQLREELQKYQEANKEETASE